jgi:superfamily II DNA/RNA helicase
MVYFINTNIYYYDQHSDRLQRQGKQALSDIKSGQAPILVATAIRLLDIAGIKHVIN